MTTAELETLDEDIAYICRRLQCFAMIAHNLHRFPWEHVQNERHMGFDVLSEHRRQPEANTEQMKRIRSNGMRCSDRFELLSEHVKTAVAMPEPKKSRLRSSQEQRKTKQEIQLSLLVLKTQSNPRESWTGCSVPKK